MATNAIVKFQENEQTILACELTTDGYFEVAGNELVDFLNNIQLVNGLEYNAEMYKVAVGVGDLAAQYITYKKTQPGYLYVVNPNADVANYDYAYVVNVKVDYSNNALFPDFEIEMKAYVAGKEVQ